MQYTDNIGLRKPETTEYYDIENDNVNADIIDSVITGIKTIGVYSATDSSNTNDYTMTYVGLTYFGDLNIELTLSHSNTGASTLTLNGVQKSIKILDANGNKNGLTGGELKVGINQLKYDGVDVVIKTSQAPTTTTLTTLASIFSSGTGLDENTQEQDFNSEVEGQSDVVINGSTLVNSAVNGDFSDGTTGWTAVRATHAIVSGNLQNTGDGSHNNPYERQASILSNLSNATIFIYAKAKGNSDTVSMNMYLTEGSSNTSNSIIKSSNLVNYQEFYDIFTDVTISDMGINIFHQYVDATTATGKVMEVDGNAGVFAINLGNATQGIYYYLSTVLGHTDMKIEAILLDQIRQGSFEGLASTGDFKVKSVNKNLFDGQLEIGGYDSLGNKDTVTDRIRNVNEFIRIEYGKYYKFSENGTPQPVNVYEYDSNKDFIQVLSSSSDYTPSSTAKFINFKLVSVDTALKIQLEKGTSVTDYVPLESSELTVKGAELSRVPNGVRSTVKKINGVRSNVRNTKPYIVNGAEAYSGFTTGQGANSDLCSAYISGLAVTLNALQESAGSAVSFDGLAEYTHIQSAFTNAKSYSTRFAAGNVYILIPESVISSMPSGLRLDGFKEYIQANNLKIIYQLATPEIIPNGQDGFEVTGNLEVYPNGTIYLEAIDDNSLIIPELNITYNLNENAKISANSKALTSVIKTFDNKTELINDKIVNSYSLDKEAYFGYVKTIDDMQDALSNYQIGASTLIEKDTVNVVIGTESLKLLSNSDVAGTRAASRNGISFDLSKTNNGLVSGDDDFICGLVYIFDVAYVSSIRFLFCSDQIYAGSNYALYSVTTGLKTGLNYLKVSKALFTVSGNFSWDTVGSYNVLWNSIEGSATAGAYVSFQLTHLVKKDLEGNYPNPCQNLGVKERDVVDGDWIVVKEFGDIVIKEISSLGSIGSALLGTVLLSSFKFKIYGKFETTSSAYINGVSWYYNSDAYISTRIYNNEIQLSFNNGLTSGVFYKDMVATYGDIIEYVLEKSGDSVSLKVYKNYDYSNPYIISCSIHIRDMFGYLGVRRTGGIATKLLALSITEINSVRHADIAEISNGMTKHAIEGIFYRDCYNIKVNAGTFDFSAKNLIGRKWYFADGTTSEEDRPTKTFSEAQTVRLVGNFSESKNCEIVSNSTISSYVGDLSDLPNLNHYLSLYNCTNVTGDLKDLPNLDYYLSLYNCYNITGDLSDLPNLSSLLDLSYCSAITGDLKDLPNLDYYLNLYNCYNITGDLSDLPNVSHYLNLYRCSNITGDLGDLPNLDYYLRLYDCSNITGDLSDLPNVSYLLDLYDCSAITGNLANLPNVSYYLSLFDCNAITGDLSDLPDIRYYINLYNCFNVTGVLNTTQVATNICLTGTGMSSSDIDNSLINLVTAGMSNGSFTATDKTRTSASDVAYTTLVYRGWTINLA